jgi:hypothetical protein
LVIAAYFFSENETSGSLELRDRIESAVQRMITDYFSLELDLLRGHGENRENPYTDAQLLLSLSLALSPVTALSCDFTLTDEERAKLEDDLGKLTIRVGEQLSDEGVKVHESARTHHFLTLHSVRALDAAARTIAHLSGDQPVEADGTFDQTGLLNRVRDEIVQQFGLHLLPAPGFDSSCATGVATYAAR